MPLIAGFGMLIHTKSRRTSIDISDLSEIVMVHIMIRNDFFLNKL